MYGTLEPELSSPGYQGTFYFCSDLYKPLFTAGNQYYTRLDIVNTKHRWNNNSYWYHATLFCTKGASCYCHCNHANSGSKYYCVYCLCHFYATCRGSPN